METKHTPENPPAFPSHNSLDENNRPHGGMSLRDYFASKALNGILSSLAVSETESVVMVTNRGGIDKFQKRIAQCAFEYADAMLSARATLNREEG